ncbi:MAG: autotransporter-associated beta strand repeat-containing protein [Verrucomicrobiota bacterium]
MRSKSFIRKCASFLGKPTLGWKKLSPLGIKGIFLGSLFIQPLFGLLDTSTGTDDQRFLSGADTAHPVQNTDASFVGAGYDWSTVGWIYRPDAIRIQNIALITPLESYGANHYTPRLGYTVNFFNGTDLIQNTMGSPLYANVGVDMEVSALNHAMAASSNVSISRILDISSGNYVGQAAFVMGSENKTEGELIAKAYITNVFNSSVNVGSGPGSTFSQAEGGDSGSPIFIAYKGQLTLAGSWYYSGGGGSPLWNGSGLDSSIAINAAIAPTGYALRYTIYDIPTDTANTANVWTGGAGSSNFASAANWQKGVVPGNLPIVLDAGANGGQSTITLNADQSVRGMLFRQSTGTTGFTFNGTGTLSIDRTGIRNEDTWTQTFNGNIALLGSQNWEAANGNLIFNGNIDNKGFLQVVQGSKDTTINGVISGTGGLAKDEAGNLFLSGANSYSGVTFLHNGTIRAMNDNTLSANSIVQFDTSNPVLLDLNGKNQTVAGVRSALDGTGVINLGGAALTVNGSTNTSYAGTIVGAGSVVKTGSGTWELTGNNNGFSGQTEIKGGTLRLSSANAWSTSSNIKFTGSNALPDKGGILELGYGDFTGNLGTGVGEIQFAGNGGFGAYGATRSVNIGNDGRTLQWGVTSGFIQAGSILKFAGSTSNAMLDFKNGIDFAGAIRTVEVNNGTAAIDTRFSGVLSNGGLSKWGAGVLELTGNNTYTGQTRINDGSILVTSANGLGTGNLTFENTGGALGLGTGDFTRGLGTGNNQVQFNASGGFYAYGANRSVNIGGAGANLTWGSGGFISTGSLILSDTASNATVDFQNGIDLGGASRTVDVRDGSVAIDAKLSGNLSNGGVIKTGTGVLQLTGNNTYTGTTQINQGTLLISNAQSLSTGNLNLNGGVLGMGTGDMTRSLGTGINQIQLSAGGGFAAFGADRTVNLGGTGAGVTWGSGNFMNGNSTFYLSTATATNTLNFVNGIDLGGSTRIISVADGAASIDARLSGVLSNGGIKKIDNGLLELTAANTYTGTTAVSGGTLRLSNVNALSASTNIDLLSGILELGAGDFTRSVGMGAGQIQFHYAPAGFSAYGADRLVNLGGNGNQVKWDVATFIGTGYTFLLSSKTADHMVEFVNGIDLNTVQQTVYVENGSAAVDARLSGVLTNGGLIKTGTGTLELTGVNTYLGVTNVNEGTLRVSGSGKLATSTNVVIQSGATFLYNAAGSLNSAVTINGGFFRYDGAAAYNGALVFTSGTIGGFGSFNNTAMTLGAGQTIAPGDNTVTALLQTGAETWKSGGSYEWTINSLSGSKGNAVGWDWININGALTLQLDSAPFVLKLDSVGVLTGWNSAQNYTWTIVTGNSGVTGFNTAQFTIDTTAFADDNSLGGGSFQLVLSGKDMNLTFSAVPEPETFWSLAVILGILWFSRKSFISQKQRI